MDRLVRSYQRQRSGSRSDSGAASSQPRRRRLHRAAGRDAAAAVEGPRHRPGHARRVQDLFARHGRRRQVAHAGRALAIAAARVCWRCRPCWSRRSRAWRGRRVNLRHDHDRQPAHGPARLSSATHAARAGARSRTAGCISVLIHLALGGFLLSLHDAARSIGDAADSGGAAGRARAGADGGRAGPPLRRERR